MNQKSLAMLFAAWLIGYGVTAQSAALRLTTENSPPFNMMEGDKIVGRATDLVREMAERAKLTISIDMLPWARAYNMALKDADTCVFSTTRTPEREPLFQWVAPLGASASVFCWPQVMVPRQIRLTSRLVLPSLRYSMVRLSPDGLGQV